jgi:hypothetical protein
LLKARLIFIAATVAVLFGKLGLLFHGGLADGSGW